MAKKVAEQLVDMLVEAGVKRIYAVTGDSLNEINDAVRKNDKIQWIHVRHEEVGAYAAGAEAQLNGQLACCAGSSGPGHVHLINGLYDAHRSGAPVLAIASTMATSEFGTRYFQETDTMKLFDDCSYYNQVATTPGQMPRMLQAAMQAAVSASGVAVIGVPGDVTARGAEDIFSSVKAFPTHPSICPSDEELEALAALLNGKEKITLFCGIGAYEDNEILIRLADIILLRAELKVKTGDEAGAIKDLNLIRERACCSPYNAAVDGDLASAIQDERDRELFVEGLCTRYFDVVRNGTFRERLKGNFKILTDKDVEDGALYFPVGIRAFNENTLMLQTPYWKRNGYAY